MRVARYSLLGLGLFTLMLSVGIRMGWPAWAFVAGGFAAAYLNNITLRRD